MPEIIVADVELISALARPLLSSSSIQRKRRRRRRRIESWTDFVRSYVVGLEKLSLAAIRKFGKVGPDFYDLLVRPANF